MIPTLVFAVAVALPSPSPPPSSVSLENKLLIEQVIDDFETQNIIAHGGYEANPLAKPFTHSIWTMLGMSLAVNGGIRLLPDSWLKKTGLTITLGIEGSNITRNAFLVKVKL